MVVPVSALICKPRFLFAAMNQANIFIALTFLQPTMAIYLRAHGYSDDMVSLNLAMMAVSYGLSATLVHHFLKCMKKRAVMMLGHIVLSFSILLIIGSKNLPQIS